MLQRDELEIVYSLKEDYQILICNAHDIRLRSLLTDHEWVIISPYDRSACEILHRHSNRYPFHHQRGQYESLESALEYIRRHDEWYYEKENRLKAVSINRTGFH